MTSHQATVVDTNDNQILEFCPDLNDLSKSFDRSESRFLYNVYLTLDKR